MTIIFSLGNMRTTTLLLLLLSLFINCQGLTSPTWQPSLFIEARSTNIIVTTEKLTGFYTYPIAFAAMQYSPIIALGMSDHIQLYLRLDGRPMVRSILK